jgi:hypothetical protein
VIQLQEIWLFTTLPIVNSLALTPCLLQVSTSFHGSTYIMMDRFSFLQSLSDWWLCENASKMLMHTWSWSEYILTLASSTSLSKAHTHPVSGTSLKASRRSLRYVLYFLAKPQFLTDFMTSASTSATVCNVFRVHAYACLCCPSIWFPSECLVAYVWSTGKNTSETNSSSRHWQAM